MRRYPEQIESEMFRILIGGNVFLLRQSAKFVLGEASHKAIVIMTNPGSFELKNVVG